MSPFEMILGAGLTALVLKGMKEKGVDPEKTYVPSEEQIKVADQYRSPVSETVRIARNLTESPYQSPPLVPVPMPMPIASQGPVPVTIVPQPAPTPIKTVSLQPVQAPVVKIGSQTIGPQAGFSVPQPGSIVSTSGSRSDITGGKLGGYVETFSSLGEALMSMENNRARMRRRRGGQAASFLVVSDDPMKEKITAADVEYYPNAAVVDAVSVEHSDASRDIIRKDSDVLPYAEEKELDLETALSTSVQSASDFVVDAQGQLSQPSQNVMEKFNQLDTTTKLMLLGAGYFAVKMLPSKYLYVAAGLLAYNQLKK